MRRIIRSVIVWAAISLSAATCQRGAPSSTVYDLVQRFRSARIDMETADVKFGSPDGRRFLLAGWSKEEESGGASWIWATAPTAELDVVLFDLEDRHLAIHCWPFTYPGSPTQGVEIELNGTPIAHFDLQPGPATYETPLPRDALVRGRNRISFRIRHLASPADTVPGSSDGRRLGVAFDVLRLTTGDARRERRVRPAEPPRVEGDGIIQSAPSQFSYALELPPAPVLRFRIDAPTGESEIEVAAQGAPRDLVFSTRNTRPHDGSREVSLGRYAGQLVEITFRSHSGAAAGPQPSEAVWRDVRVLGRGSEALVDTNIILIVVDTLRADHVSAYGGAEQTPHIDALARAGVLFRRAHAHVPITGPSHASIFTGLLPVDHGVRNNTQVFEHAPTLAERFRSRGWSTAAFVSLGVLSRAYGFARGFDLYDDNFADEAFRSAGEINEAVFPWLERAPRPFFLWVHYSDPHEPYAPPTAQYTRVRVALDGAEVLRFAADARTRRLPLVLPPGPSTVQFLPDADGPHRRVQFRAWSVSSPDVTLGFAEGWQASGPGFFGAVQTTTLPATIRLVNAAPVETPVTLRFFPSEMLSLEEARSRYAGEVAYVDAEIGRLVEKLVSLGLWHNSLLVLTSDHGESLGEHDLVGHVEQLYEPLMRVPLLVAFPGRLPGGQVVEEPAQHVDVLPTLFRLLNLSPPGSSRGRPLLDQAGHVAVDGGRPVLMATYRPEARLDREAVLSGGYKYIVTGSEAREELYLLPTDGGERSNLVAARADVAARLRDVLAHVGRVGSGEDRAAEAAPLSDEDRERLRILGYSH